MAKIGNRSIFVVMIVIIVAVIVDNSIVGIATSAGGMRSSFSDIALFTVMVLVFAIGQYVILRFVKSKYLNRRNETAFTKSHIKWTDKITVFLQYVLVVILVSVVLQIAFISSYHIYSLISAIIISYGLSILLLSLLAKHFFSWYRSNHSLVVLFYGLSMSLISINAIITITYLNIGYTDNPPFVRSLRSLTGSLVVPDDVYNYAYTLTVILLLFSVGSLPYFF